MSKSTLQPQTVNLAEWSDVSIPVELTERDRRLVGRLRAKRQLEVEELRAGVRVSSRSWVGVVRFERFEVRVQPKLAGDAIGVAQMLDFTHGIEQVRRTAGEQHLATNDTKDLFELLALLLLEETERVVRGGFVADYQTHDSELGVVRGRILVDRQLLVRFGQVDRVWCRFDELEHDTDENRLLGRALLECARRIRSERLHRRLRALSAVFQEVCDPEAIDLTTARKAFVYDRKNAHYERAHQLAWLILDALGIEDVFAANEQAKCFAFMLDMNVLFEHFITRLVSAILPRGEYRVQAQERNRSVLWDAVRHSPYGSIRPDLVVRHAAEKGRAVPIDAKYKRYDKKDLSSADIYQGLLYAQAYGRTDLGETPIALIVHPTGSAKLAVERIELQRPGIGRAAELVVVGLPVKLTLECLRARKPSPADAIRDTVVQALATPGMVAVV